MHFAASLAIAALFTIAVAGQSVQQINGEAFLDGINLGAGNHAIQTVKENGKVYFQIETTRPGESSSSVQTILAKDQNVGNVNILLESSPNGSSSTFFSSGSGNQTFVMPEFVMPPMPEIKIPKMPKMPKMPRFNFENIFTGWPFQR